MGIDELLKSRRADILQVERIEKYAVQGRWQ
jgi:hypothetical protein